MSIGDIVSARIAQASPSTIQLQPPHFGRVTAEAAGPPLTETVLWDTALESTVSAANAANLFLDVIEDADQATFDKFIGQNVLRIAPGGPLPNAPAGGHVVRVQRRGGRRLSTPALRGLAWLRAASTCSRSPATLFFEDVATQFAVVTPSESQRHRRHHPDRMTAALVRRSRCTRSRP